MGNVKVLCKSPQVWSLLVTWQKPQIGPGEAQWLLARRLQVSEAIRVTGMYTYGRVELEPRGAPPPPGWTELMLAMHHQEPVGRCFQR